jgi:hypothetical protein
MEQSITETHKNVGAIMHGSTFLKYFFPLGNFFAPLLLWTLHKENPYLNHHGKQVINFQLSVFVYAICIALLSLPFVAMYASDFIGLVESLENASNVHAYHVSNITSYVVLVMVFGFLFLGLFLLELYYVITGTIKASKGEPFSYPLCIQFINDENITEIPEEKTNDDPIDISKENQTESENP